MVAEFVAAAVVAVMFHIVVQEGSFPAGWVGKIWMPARLPGRPGRRIGSKLMAAFAAEIFLKTDFIFAVTIKEWMLLHFGQ